jgi:hypothetical protein
MSYVSAVGNKTSTTFWKYDRSMIFLVIVPRLDELRIVLYHVP